MNMVLKRKSKLSGARGMGRLGCAAAASRAALTAPSTLTATGVTPFLKALNTCGGAGVGRGRAAKFSFTFSDLGPARSALPAPPGAPPTLPRRHAATARPRTVPNPPEPSRQGVPSGRRAMVTESGSISQSESMWSKSPGSAEALPWEDRPSAWEEASVSSGAAASRSGGHERRGCGGSHGRLRVEPPPVLARAASGASGAVRLVARAPHECCAAADGGDGDHVQLPLAAAMVAAAAAAAAARAAESQAGCPGGGIHGRGPTARPLAVAAAAAATAAPVAAALASVLLLALLPGRGIQSAGGAEAAAASNG